MFNFLQRMRSLPGLCTPKVQLQIPSYLFTSSNRGISVFSENTERVKKSVQLIYPIRLDRSRQKKSMRNKELLSRKAEHLTIVKCIFWSMYQPKMTSSFGIQQIRIGKQYTYMLAYVTRICFPLRAVQVLHRNVFQQRSDRRYTLQGPAQISRKQSGHLLTAIERATVDLIKFLNSSREQD